MYSNLEKFETIAESMDGWYYYKEIDPLLKIINDFHKTSNITAGVVEIGVYRGKSFIALSSMTSDNEVRLAIDSFGVHNTTDWMYGNHNLNKKMFEDNYKKVFNNTNYKLLQKNSNLVTSNEIKNVCNGKVRFFSIDGDHTVNGTYHDLALAKESVCDYGVIIVDDYTNTGWPTVKEGVDKFLENNKDIKILKSYYNKLFLCHETFFDKLYEILNK